MSNLDRAAVDRFRKEPWPWEKGVEVQASVGALPPLYIAGFDPSISSGRLTIGPGEASVDGVRVDTEETLITDSHYVGYRLGSFSYYVYLARSGSFFVDVVAPESNEKTRVLSHKFRDGRYICYFETDTSRDVSIAHKALPSELSAGDLANASARDQIALQLGYTDYASMVTQVASDGSIITSGGYLRADLIEAGAIIASKIASDAVTADKIIAGAVTDVKLASDALAFPTEGLVAYYSFDDGSAIDTSGNGYHGTITGAVVADGKSRKALSFDGVDDNVSVASNASISFEYNEPFTLSLWVKRDAAQTAGANIIGKTASGLWMQVGYFITDLSNESQFRVGISEGSSKDLLKDFNYPSSYTSNTWTHLVLTYDGTSAYTGLKLYANGAEITGYNVRNALTGATIQNAEALKIAGPVADFDGLIDEVRIYNRALSAAEVAQLYRFPGGVEPGVLDGAWIKDASILTDKIVAQQLALISPTLGFGGTGDADDPDSGDRRAYIDDDELKFQRYNGTGWETGGSIARRAGSNVFDGFVSGSFRSAGGVTSNLGSLQEYRHQQSTSGSSHYIRAAVGNGSGTIVGIASPSGAAYIHRSTDRGFTWTQTTFTATMDSLNSVIWTGTNFVISGRLSTTPRVRYSSDGSTWSTATTALTASVPLLFGDANSSRIVLQTLDNAIETSVNDGQTWQSGTTPPARIKAMAGDVAIAFNSSTAAVYYSTDACVTWSSSVTTAVAFDLAAIGGGVIVAYEQVLGGANVYRSTDNGQTWSGAITVETAAANDALGSHIVFGDNQFFLWFYDDSESRYILYASRDYGQTWEVA